MRPGKRGAALAALAPVVLLVSSCGWEPAPEGSANVGQPEPAPLRVVPPSAVPPPEARAGGAGAPHKLPPISGSGALSAYVMRGTLMYDRPGGRVVARVRTRTEFGSVRVFAVIDRRPGWLGVLAAERPNERLGWLPAKGIALFRVKWAMEADLSDRRLVVKRNGRVLARVPVAIGRPSSPTPTGTYAVTDKLISSRRGSPYGCCILALTGHQRRLPQGWGGGDRLAIHTTSIESSIGYASTLGCLRAARPVMRQLIYAVPLGTRLRVRQ